MQSKLEVCPRSHAESVARPKLFALLLLLVLQLGFWIIFARIVRLAPVVAETLSSASLELLVLAPLIVLTPVAAKLWSWLAARGLEPSTAAKFSLGFLGLAASCTCLAASIEWPFAGDLGLAALTFAALSLGPACVRAVWQLSPEGQRGMFLVCVLLSFGFAWPSSGWMHASAVSAEVGFNICLALGYGCVATAVLSSFMWHGLATLASTEVPRGTAHSLGAESVVSAVGSVGAGSVGSVGAGSLG
jgi:dipeptide/tripeptide permease